MNHLNFGAHRLAYTLLRGPVPAGMDIDHVCRNRRCVNPHHMEPVTPKENSARGELLRGEAHPSAVLSERQVHAIRGACAVGQLHTEIAKRYGVSAALIDKIASRQLWKRLKEKPHGLD